MEENKSTTEDLKVDGVGETEVATETKIEMISKEEAQKMVSSALAKKLPPKEEMEAFKQWKESQKTEVEKQAEKDKLILTKEQENINLKRENALLKKGVNAEDIDYIMFKVGKIDGEFEENLENFLKENTKYIQKEEQEEVIKNTGVRTRGITTQVSGVDAILQAKHPNLYK